MIFVVLFRQIGKLRRPTQNLTHQNLTAETKRVVTFRLLKHAFVKEALLR